MSNSLLVHEEHDLKTQVASADRRRSARNRNVERLRPAYGRALRTSSRTSQRLAAISRQQRLCCSKGSEDIEEAGEVRAERKATSRRKWSEDLAHVIASPMGVEVRMCACRFSKEVISRRTWFGHQWLAPPGCACIQDLTELAHARVRRGSVSQRVCGRRQRLR